MRRPGKRYIVTSQAVPMPIRKLRAPTPAISPSVRRKASGSTLATRCGQVSPLDLSAMRPRAIMGRSATKEMRNAAADQARLPLSLRRANRPCKVGMLRRFAPSSAPFSATVAASLAPVDHQGGNRLER
jgi:hypothetical protein